MNPPAGADSTRDRILAAATAEFSRHGIAGARIERIAKAARTSKERVYAYFDSKEALYRFVSVQELAAVAEATRMDPADLPGYAGRIHDYFTRHPERFRLMTWGELELANAEPESGDPMRESVGRKIEQLREAQEAGRLDASLEPLDILMTVNQIATAWVAHPGLGHPGLGLTAPGQDRDAFLAARRAAIVATVQRLFPVGTDTFPVDTATATATATDVDVDERGEQRPDARGRVEGAPSDDAAS